MARKFENVKDINDDKDLWKISVVKEKWSNLNDGKESIELMDLWLLTIRYKLDVEVGDGHVKATFVLWDRECEQLIGKSAAVLRAEMLEAGITDPLDYPKDIDLIAEKNLAIKVKLQPK
ncbi:unnamed protein product [Trifolium pratense]|uniref:Uncharacterized protein n=1 Tax=Trifolium pratense TaxID=57577 RepID=A0ACB0J1K2_TRIPR|nr:unnamed protein product [Trifolium pratense]